MPEFTVEAPMEKEKYEIVKFVDNGFELEVNVSPEENTVWLSQAEMSMLFDRDISVISRHIKNVLSEGECDEKSNLHFLQIPSSDKPTILYSLDIIISVGYRVKSQRGVVFRRWATSVLRQYLLRGYTLDSTRTLVTNENYLNLLNVVNDMKSSQISLEERVEKLESKYPELNNYVFACGQMYDAISFLCQIVEKARSGIILIDNYVDRGTLDILSHKRQGVKVRIITSKDGNRITKKELDTFNAQYHNLSLETTDKVHDRYLIIDTMEMYHIGASLKDAGKKLFGMDLINDPATIRFVLKNAV